jgi:hypothetical protein
MNIKLESEDINSVQILTDKVNALTESLTQLRKEQEIWNTLLEKASLVEEELMLADRHVAYFGRLVGSIKSLIASIRDKI